jgi:hypothetical protein
MEFCADMDEGYRKYRRHEVAVEASKYVSSVVADRPPSRRRHRSPVAAISTSHSTDERRKSSNRDELGGISPGRRCRRSDRSELVMEPRRCRPRTTPATRSGYGDSSSMVEVPYARDRRCRNGGRRCRQASSLPPVDRVRCDDRPSSRRSARSPGSAHSPRSGNRHRPSAFRPVGNDDDDDENRKSAAAVGNGDSDRLPFVASSSTSASREVLSNRSFRPIRVAAEAAATADVTIPHRPIPRLSIPQSTAVVASKSVNNLAAGSASVEWRGVSLADKSGQAVSRPGGGFIVRSGRIPLVVIAFVIAFLSPVVMVMLPLIRSYVREDGSQRLSQSCSTVECQKSIMSLVVRLVLIASCLVVAFFRSTASATCCLRRLTNSSWSTAATLPRLEPVETAAVGLVVLDAVVFWSFYAVRLAAAATGSGGREAHDDDVAGDFHRTVSFALSMADSLAFVVALTILVVLLGNSASTSAVDDGRSAVGGEAHFCVRVVRSSDGCSETFAVGKTSIQRLALHCIRRQFNESRSANRRRTGQYPAIIIGNSMFELDADELHSVL